MARSEILVTTVIRDGVTPGAVTISDSINDHYIVDNDGNVSFLIISHDASPQTVTFSTPLTVDDLLVEDFVLDVPAGGSVVSGGYRRKSFNQDVAAGSVYIHPSVSGTLEIRAFKFVPAG